MKTKIFTKIVLISFVACITSSSFAQNVYGGYSTTEHTPNPWTGGYTSKTYGSSGNSTTEHTPNPWTGGYTSKTYGR